MKRNGSLAAALLALGMILLAPSSAQAAFIVIDDQSVEGFISIYWQGTVTFCVSGSCGSDSHTTVSESDLEPQVTFSGLWPTTDPPAGCFSGGQSLGPSGCNDFTLVESDTPNSLVSDFLHIEYGALEPCGRPTLCLPVSGYFASDDHGFLDSRLGSSNPDFVWGENRGALFTGIPNVGGFEVGSDQDLGTPEAPVPEPGTLLLFGSALITILCTLQGGNYATTALEDSSRRSVRRSVLSTKFGTSGATYNPANGCGKPGQL